MQQSYVGPRADQFMYISSNILNKEETAELNSLGRVTTTIDKDCSYVRGGCSFVITTPQAPCLLTVNGEHVPTREVNEKYGLGEVWYGNTTAIWSGNYGDLRPEDSVTKYYGLYPATVHHMTVQRNLFTFITDDLTNKTYADYRPVLFELACWLTVFDNSTHLEPAPQRKVKKKIILKTHMCKCYCMGWDLWLSDVLLLEHTVYMHTDTWFSKLSGSRISPIATAASIVCVLFYRAIHYCS